jgi:hypothetical protein
MQQIFWKGEIMDESCEIVDCSMPGTVCPACLQCLCWRHRRDSPCETCQKLISQDYFKKRLGRLVSIGICVLLIGILFLLVPHESYGLIIELAISFLIVGALLIWLGILGRK